ncbi:MAG: hypothetical protein ACP5P6_09385 [Candidatus Saccharicenans sp.]
MLKKVIRSAVLVSFIILLLFLFQKVKDHQLKTSVLSEAISSRGEIYYISDNIKRVSNQINSNVQAGKELNSYKLVYEIDVDCFICLEKLKKINDFVVKAKINKEIALVIITTEKSIGYVEYCISQSIPNYDLCVAQQKFKRDNFDLYLLDDTNRIVIAGDFIKYPFLEKEYINCLLKPPF